MVDSGRQGHFSLYMPTVLGLRLACSEVVINLEIGADEKLLWRKLMRWQRLQAPSGHAEGLCGLDKV